MTNRLVLGVLIGVLWQPCATSVPPGSVGLFVYASSGIDNHVLERGSVLAPAVEQHPRCSRRSGTSTRSACTCSPQDDVHLEMQLGIAIRPNVKELYALQQDLGVRYYDTIVQSAFFTATRTVFAHYNMVDIPENSEKIEAEIREHVAAADRGPSPRARPDRAPAHRLSAGGAAAIEQRLVVQQQETQKEAEIKIAGEEAQIAHIRAESAAETAKISATQRCRDRRRFAPRARRRRRRCSARR